MLQEARTHQAGVGASTRGTAAGAGPAGAGRRRRLSSNALTATRKLDPDMDRAAISGRRTRPRDGSNTPAAMGSTYEVNKASVVCGNVQTANATVYIIDTVLTPPAK